MKRVRVILDFVIGSIDGEDQEINERDVQGFRDRAVEVVRNCEGTAMWSDDLPVYVESLNVNTAVLDDDRPNSRMLMSNPGMKDVEKKYAELLQEEEIKVGGGKDQRRQKFFFAGALEAIKVFAPHFLTNPYWLLMILSGRSILEDRKKNHE